MRGDPLAALARVRAAETLMARRALADAMIGRAAADRAATAAGNALRIEGTGVESPADFVAWLPRGLAARDAAAREVAATEAILGERRDDLAVTRAAERLVEVAIARREAERRREALRREGARLDDLRT